MRYRLLLSLREDYLPELEGWREAMPSLCSTACACMPMGPEQAYARRARQRAPIS